LQEKDDHGIVIVDRLDLSKKNVLNYKNGFDYLKEKFQKGNCFDGDRWVKHTRILSYSISCEGSSHLSSLNDILTGALMYLANGSNPDARTALQEQLESVMWKSPNSRFADFGLSLRPVDRLKLDESVEAEYELLRAFLNTKHS